MKDLIPNNEGAYEIELSLKNQQAEIIGFRLYNDKGEEVDMQYDMKEKKFSMDRRKSGEVNFNENFPMLTWTAIEEDKDEMKLRLFVDRSDVYKRQHFMLKQLFKKIVIVNDENMDPDAYNELSNTTYTNDEQWQKIADDFQFAYDNLPEVQIEKGRPAQAAAAAYLAKTYLLSLIHIFRQLFCVSSVYSQNRLSLLIHRSQSYTLL